MERVNRTVQGFLRSLVDGPSQWDQFLPRAVHVYNATFHSELKMSPRDFLLSKCHEVDASRYLHSVDSTWRIGHPGFIPFSLNQTVIKQNQLSGHLTTNKFADKYTGPYEISKVLHKGVTYEIRDAARWNSASSSFTVACLP